MNVVNEKKSLLRQIRDKESDLSRTLEMATNEAEAIVSAARREAAGIVARAEQESAAEAEEYLKRELERLQREIETLKRDHVARIAAIDELAGKRMPLAAGKIVGAVILKP